MVFSIVGIALALFLSMAGLDKRPAPLDRAKVEVVAPQEFYRLYMKGREVKDRTWFYQMTALNEKKELVFFNFPDEPETLAIFNKIRGNGLVKIWTERNDFAKVIQLQLGGINVVDYEATSMAQSQEAHNWFFGALASFLFGLSMIFIARRFKPTHPQS